MHKAKSAQAMLLLCCGWSSLSLAADFYTIIGPDGRPMIIQQNAASVKPKHEKVKVGIQSSKDETKSSEPLAMTNSTQVENTHFSEESSKATSNVTPSVQKKQKNQRDQHEAAQVMEQTLAIPKMTQQISKERVPSNSVQDNQKPKKIEKNDLEVQTIVVNPSQNTHVQPKNTLNKTEISDSEANETLKSKRLVSMPESVSISKSTVVNPNHKSKNDDSKFTEIDGVQYVDNEYLEDKEFNLEGKKRFYIMSEAGVAGGRQFETVEREKGISKSVFSKFLKSDNTIHEPIVLSSTYFRLPKKQVVENLEQACFTGKKIEKTKFLSVDKDEIGFWPVAPFKENFAYEVVKLDQQVENIKLTSYASSQKNPSYYWPLVVFLDRQGCVIEGVTGFKSEDVDANHRQFSSLVGILKKPRDAYFLFMTPLAESVDVDNLKLSNIGQIKLNVLR